MDCNVAQEQLMPYLLGALSSGEMAGMERHLNGCAGCTAKLSDDGELVTQLAYSVPRLEAPARVRRGLLARIDAEAGPPPLAEVLREWSSLARVWGRSLVAHSGLSAATLLVGLMVLGGIWFNNRLDETALEKTLLASKLESVVRGEQVMKETVEKQRHLLYMTADPGASVNLLSATKWSPDSSGMVITKAGQEPVLAVLDLPPLPAGESYQVWLVKDGLLHNAGGFTVDATGYGETNIRLTAPIRSFEAIVITVQREGADTGRTEVLRGDL